MRNLKSVPFVLTAVVLVASCGKKKEDEATTSSATDKIANASSLMLTVNAALASIPSSSVDSTSLALASKGSANAKCTEHGQPLKDGVTATKGVVVADADRMQNSEKGYSARLFTCLSTLTAKDGASVETIQGSLAQVGSVLCSFEASIGSFEYTTAGNKFVDSASSKVVTLSDECWPQGKPDGISSVTIDSATATLLDASTGYQKELKFTATAQNVDYKLRFFNKDGVIGFKTMNEGKSPGIGGYSELVLDSKNGVILVNTVDDRNGNGGADSAYRRTVRMQVKGTIDPDKLTFSAVTAVQGIYSNSGNYASDPTNFSYDTIIGDTTNGYYGRSATYSGSSFTTSYEGCTGLKSTCSGTGIKLTDSTFYSSRTEWAAHLASGLPPCYDGKDITAAALPTTGAFGVCTK